jgi:hypothetical protein
MSWTSRLQTSWQLLQSSIRVLRDQPRLLLFPIISTLCALTLALFFFAPVIAVGIAVAKSGGDHVEMPARINAIFYAYGAVIYLVSMFIATFFNVAFYNEIIHAFAGEPVSLGRGLRFAVGRLPAIAMWSLLAGTVGLIIRAIEERLGWLGKIVMGLIGTAWSVAAVFAIPVIIRRSDTNPLAVLRDSAVTLKRTWGESLIGFVGLHIGGAVLALGSIVFAIAAVFGLAALHQWWLVLAVLGAWLLAVILWSFIISVATHVYRCALYVYASEGVVPGPFTADMMNAGWKVKKA